MSNKPFKFRKFGLNQWVPACILSTVATLATGLSLHAQSTTTTTTIAGGKPSLYYGYADGATLQSLFHTPSGISVDPSGKIVLVADRDNNVIRYLDLNTKLTWTLEIDQTNLLNKPVGVLEDNSDGTLLVLNRGNGKNGNVISLDEFGDIVFTNAANLTNVTAMTVDSDGNVFVTASNTIVEAPFTSPTNIVLLTIPNAGSSLSGIIARSDGTLAICDSGRNGVYQFDPNTQVLGTNAGFNGTGDFTTNGNNFTSAAKAKFNQPMGITEAGDGSLIVADYGNNRIKVITTTGIVTNLAGISQKYWHGSFPAWLDGPTTPPDLNATNAESRLPFGVAFSPDGTVYVTEDFYHTIRKVTGNGLGLPPPPPTQVGTPEIGYVDFPANSVPFGYTSVFHMVTNSFIFNNDAPIVIIGAAGSQTFYNFSNTPTIGKVAVPTKNSASANSGYTDGLVDPSQVANYAVAGIAPNVAIKAISEKNDGSPNSAVAQALFEYVCGNPVIQGGNAAQFTLSEVTSNSLIYYTLDGSDPRSNSLAIAQSLTPSTNGGVLLATINIATNNFVFKAFARKPNYQDSQVVSNFFSSANFAPNFITFGVTNGELSSSFIARPGQYYYAPVTLELQPGGETIYSLQFNLTVTNGLGTTAKIVNDAGFDFHSMLQTQVQPSEGLHFPPNQGQWYLDLPAIAGNLFTSAAFTNSSENLLGIGWLFRTGIKYVQLPPQTPSIDFDTGSQDLITYSIAHDTLFKKGDGLVILGAYSFQIPTNANIGDTYDIQIGSPSATRDGVGSTPAESAFIQPPAFATVVTVGVPSYLVGDAAPFRWLNAGDFGDANLDNSDVMQVYQAAIEGVDLPPAGSDLFAAMDSSGSFGAFDTVHQYYTNTIGSPFPTIAAMFNGDDTTINTNCFGDGILNAADLFVTFRRSLDPSLTWFRRVWTNGQFVAVSTPNLAYNNNIAKTTNGANVSLAQVKSKSLPIGQNQQPPSVVFSAGDSLNATAGQTIGIPVTASVFGAYPLRIVGLNVSVQALDGSPAVAQTVTFASGTGLGSPTMFSQPKTNEYCAAWLTNGIDGLTGSNALIGTLLVSIPANAKSSSAYSVQFNKASGSPNGQATFPDSKYTGLITLSSRTNSMFNDGIPDSWRLRWFGTVYNALSQSNADACGDGISNWQKYLAGVDPTVPNAFPQLKSEPFIPSGSTAAIHWPTVIGKHYVIMRSSSLYNQPWSIVSTNSGTGGDMEYDDNYNGSSKFYRVLIQP